MDGGRHMRKLSLLLVLCMVLVSAMGLTGCASYDFAETDTAVVLAEDALAMMADGNVILVDMQDESDYNKNHVENSVNIQRSDINVNEPFSNMVAPKETIENVMGSRGISNDTMVIAYDNKNNMDASRLWWTLKVYGHDNVKVVSGGLTALEAAGASCSDMASVITKAEFTATDLNEDYIATKADIEAQVNEPDANMMLIDTRSFEEFNAGTIPGSVHIEYLKNNHNDKTIKSSRDIQITYIEKGLEPETTAVLYCKTSIRGAETFVALWNAGYRNIKLYDGAWVEWSADKDAPSDTPADNSTPVNSNSQDNS